MRQVRIGVQRTSRRSTRSGWTIASLVMGMLTLAVAAWAAPAAAASDYLLMTRSELLARPTSGTAWANLKSVADASFGTANLCDQDEDHHLRTLAGALVYARTGSATYGSRARFAIMTAIKTQRVGCGNAVLSLGRQLTAYVLAADFADLSGADDAAFRAWLVAIRTKGIGGHSTWNSLSGTHRASANNWGAFAGASRIAASRYLGDTTDVANAARVTQGFLGDRAAYSGFTMQLDSEDLSWSCHSQSSYTPENGACTKGGVNVNGAIVTDISRGGSVRWPPAGEGVSYQMESIQGLGLQVELLYRGGYPGAWGWSSNALKRAADLVARSKAAGGPGWNETIASRQMPWLLNKRYGTSYPTAQSKMGRAIGFTDWLWGGGGGSPPPPTATPKPTAAPTATPKPTATPVPTPPPPPPPGDVPVVTTPRVNLSTTSQVSTSGVPTVVGWNLASSDDPLKRYEFQAKVDGGSFAGKSLASSTAKFYRTTLGSGREYTYRVRPVDSKNRVGAWRSVGPVKGISVPDNASSIAWSGAWSTASHGDYLGDKVHWTKTAGAKATFTFKGSSIAWVGPVGPTRGKAYVHIDGKYIKTVDLKASSFVARRILFAATLPQGTHKITIQALGTSGRPTVAIDAFFVVAPS